MPGQALCRGQEPRRRAGLRLHGIPTPLQLARPDRPGTSWSPIATPRRPRRHGAAAQRRARRRAPGRARPHRPPRRPRSRRADQAADSSSAIAAALHLGIGMRRSISSETASIPACQRCLVFGFPSNISKNHCPLSARIRLLVGMCFTLARRSSSRGS